MKKTLFTLLLPLSIVLLFAASCKKTKCPEGFECVDNTCLCPEGKFEGNGLCRELNPNEYYASLGHCICADTVFFEIRERTDTHIVARLDLGWGYQENHIPLVKLPDGDSLYTETGSYTSELACPINGRLTTTQIFGKFIENDTKIRVTLKYMWLPNLEEELGRCAFVLHR